MSDSKKVKKRKVDVVVISDIHLGTYGCRAKELLNYLKTVQPKTLILNGDIIDIWQFKKRYFPKSHMKILKYITTLLTKGTEVYYITGNHDEMLRRFVGFELGNFKIVNKLILELDNHKKAWLFHGDVFDVTMQHSKWLAHLGAIGYDSLILINNVANFISERILNKGRLSFSKKIKNSVKGAVKHINNFENIAAEIAIDNKYDYVVCGHIHHPEKRMISNTKGEVMYLNSGDWIENLTALEYNKGTWSIYSYQDDTIANKLEINTTDEITQDPELNQAGLKTKDLFNEMVKEFQVLSQENATEKE